MKVILNNQQFQINEEHSSGEWKGIKSNKWNGGIKMIRQKEKENLFSNSSLEPIPGRKHFSNNPSEELLFKPEKRMFNELKKRVQIETKKQGIKSIKRVFSQTKIDFSKRLFEHKFGLESTQPFQIRTFFPNGNTRTITETDLEKSFGSKGRIPSLDMMRNGMSFKTPGDKMYKNPEYSSNFYKEGGLIPGSSNKFLYSKNISKRSDNFYQTLDFSKTTLNPDKLWCNKVKKEKVVFDMNYVQTLSVWEKNILGDVKKPADILPKGNNLKGSLSPTKSNLKPGSKK